MVYGVCQTLRATPGNAWHVCQVATENAVATARPEPGFVHPGLVQEPRHCAQPGHSRDASAVEVAD